MAYNFDKIYINGHWCDSTSGRFIEVENPATLEHFAQVPEGNEKDIAAAVKAAHEAFKSWSNTELAVRVGLMKKMLTIFEGYQDKIIDLEVKELGASWERPLAFLCSLIVCTNTQEPNPILIAQCNYLWKKACKLQRSIVNRSGLSLALPLGTTRSVRSSKRLFPQSLWATPLCLNQANILRLQPIS